MERNMYQDDFFERSLKRKADEYRMYPSDQSWSKIQNRLHSSNGLNWKALAAFLVLISISISLSNHSGTGFTKSYFITAAAENTGQQTVVIENKTVVYKTVLIPKTTPLADITVPSAGLDANKVEITAIAKNHIPESQDETVNEIQPVTEIIALKQSTSKPNFEVNRKAGYTTIAAGKSNSIEALEQAGGEPVLQISATESRIADLKPQPVFKPAAEQSTLSSSVSAAETSQTITEATPAQQSDAQLNYEVKVPMLVKPRPSKRWQFYVTPSSSYRVLVSENRYWLGNLPQNDVESEVTHKSAFGAEAGAALLIPIAKGVRFKTGLQFNYTRYSVEAYKKAPEPTSIQINNTNIVRSTSLANNSGYRITEVANQTFQLSIPIGVELTVAGSNRNAQWNIAGTIQPTYLLDASGYLITGDYKNYVKAPDLLSNMNLNAGFETFIRWNAGKFDLQAGPQIRYQLFSNTEKGYPIREHLVDYGFKIGIIKRLK